MKNLTTSRNTIYKFGSSIKVIFTIIIVVLLLFGLNSSVLANDIAGGLEQGIQATGHSVVYADYSNGDAFDPNTPEGIEIYNAIAFGYIEDNYYRAAREIFIVGGKNGDIGFNISVYRFDTEEYAKDALQSGIEHNKRLLGDTTASSSSSDIPQTEEEALAQMADEMFNSSRYDITEGTFHGNPSYSGHGYTVYSSSEADQFQKEMFGDIHSYSYTWTQSNLMITILTLTDGLLDSVTPHIYTALLEVDGNPGQSSETPVPLTPQLNVTLSSNHFKQLDEEITITVKLKDQLGESVINEVVTLENIDNGSLVNLTTDNYGNVTFVVSHTSPDIALYNYKISGQKMSKTLKIPVFKAIIDIELNPITQKPYVGIIAEGTKELELTLDYYNMPDGKLSVKLLLGTVTGTAVKRSGTIELTNGKAIIKYVPPAYIADDKLTTWNDDLISWCAEDILVFSYTTWDDEVIDYEIPITLYRPPVMLVHGFTGDASTWQTLDGWLQNKKYTTVRKEYYAGNNSIPAQALELHNNIRLELDKYQTNNIKDGKVDVIAHSMGGLITRYYTNHTQYYTGQVRKLIMVGTPNHGCSWSDLQLGRLQSWIIGKHESAAEQLYENNPFIKQLNYGESIGTHLNPDMQYAVAYSYSSDPKFFGGDVVVAATSAVLNGVQSFQVNGGVHSGAINSTPMGVLGTPITDDEAIFNKIQTWLTADIFRPALKNTKVELMKTEGNVTIKSWDGANRVDKIIDESMLKDGSYKFEVYDDIITGDSKAIIRIRVNNTTVGYINLDKNSHIRIGNASSKHIDIKMLEGKARYITFKNGGMHFAVEIETKDGSWQTITGLNTDFVISLDDTTDVFVLEGQASIAAETNNDKISQRTVGEDEAANIDTAGKISDMSIEDSGESWWEDDFYKIPFFTKIKESITGLISSIQLKALSIGHSIYIVLIAALILLIIIFKSRKSKFFFWLFMIALSAFCTFLLYYFASDMQIPVISLINNFLSGFNDNIIKIGVGVILALTLLSGLVSTGTGKRKPRAYNTRRRSNYNNNAGYDYNDGYDYDDDGDDGDDGGDDGDD